MRGPFGKRGVGAHAPTSGKAQSERGHDVDEPQPASDSHESRKPKKTSGPAMIAADWWNRLITAVYSGSLSSQTERYASHRTKGDYLWNTAGLTAWGIVFPVLSVITSQLVGVEQAGRFSMAFVIGMLLFFVANYGVRTYQVSDVNEAHSFADYQANRIITCAAALVAGLLYCQMRGYDSEMFKLCMGMVIYRAIDGLADVYEGRLQQMDKLYLSGASGYCGVLGNYWYLA